MTAVLTPGRRALITAVHAAKSSRGLDDDTYRDMLAAQANGKRSAKDCTDAELRRVLEHLNGSRRPSGRKRADTTVARKARALWLSLHSLGLVTDPSESALAAWVKRQYRVDDLAWLPPRDGFVVIEGLKDWARRGGVDWGYHKDPRRCVLAAQWRRLVDAGAAPARDLGAHASVVVRRPSVAFCDAAELDRLITDLGQRIRALPVRSS